MKAVKIIAGIALLAVCVLAWFAVSASKNAEYWQNFRKTEPARNARHKKEPETEPEPESDTKPETEQP